MVCSREEGMIKPHTHRNAQLSAVFNVRTEAGNTSGEQEFQATENYFSHRMAISYDDAAVAGVCLLRSSIGCWCFLRISPIGSRLIRGTNAIFGVLNLAITPPPARVVKCGFRISWTGFP